MTHHVYLERPPPSNAATLTLISRRLSVCISVSLRGWSLGAGRDLDGLPSYWLTLGPLLVLAITHRRRDP